MIAVRRLTREGIARFRSWLEKGGHGAAPTDLLSDPETSEPIQPAATVEQRTFASRLELGEYLAAQLKAISAIRFDVGTWDWLSLYYIDVLAPAKPDGTRDLKQIYRYTLELKNRLWSRHVLRMSWMAGTQAARTHCPLKNRKSSKWLFACYRLPPERSPPHLDKPR